MLGHIGQEPDAGLQRGTRYQPQRGLVQIGAIGKRRILPGINQRVHNHPLAGVTPAPQRTTRQHRPGGRENDRRRHIEH